MVSNKSCLTFLAFFIVCVIILFELKEENFVKNRTILKNRPRPQRRTTIGDKHHDKRANSTYSSSQEPQEGQRYGNVMCGTEHIIIYNSVPKCGSRTFGQISRRIFVKRNIDMNYYSLRNESRPVRQKERNQIEIKHFMAGIKAPAYIQGHGLYVDFEKKHPRPIYINFIRDPVARMVSAFYFTRFGDGFIPKGLLKEKRKNMSIGECIQEKRTCTKPGMYPEIFCGFNSRCGKDHQWALERAKFNIDNYYTYIGILEEYEASLMILEHLLPDMYSGSVESYHSILNEEDSRIEKMKTKNKEPLSQELNDTATQKLAVDYDLYNFIYDKHRKLKARFRIT